MARVLYVDADDARTRSACDLMAVRGHQVISAASAERAMICAEQDGPYDAVVTHLILPSIDGAELCRWLTRRPTLASALRVVFSASGVRLRVDFQQGLPRWLPAHVFLQDVDEVEHLIDAVERALDQR